MRRAIRLTLLTLLPFCLWAQTLTRMVAKFPVIVEGDTLSMPFSGGFNGPVPQFLDWDDDGFLICSSPMVMDAFNIMRPMDQHRTLSHL